MSIKPLLVGSKIFPVNIIQGPLAGISCAPFRLLTWEHSKPAFSCTEMISCKALIYNPKLASQRYLNKAPKEGPVCFQLASCEPKELAEATKRVTDLGADLIDLNCGCPVKKVRSKGAGSKLLADPLRLYQLIRTMKQNTQLPVSIKIRVQGNSDEKFNMAIANVIRDGGADCVVVHGRHWTEHYETPCHHDEIKIFVDELKIPVIGNGDITCIQSLKKMYATGCAGVMISRAGVGQPWLIRKLIAEMNKEIFTPPSNNEIALMFIEHILQLATLLDNDRVAILQARKLAWYYARGLIKRDEFCTAVNSCDNLENLKNIALHYFLEY